jgi:hypothetical protein
MGSPASQTFEFLLLQYPQQLRLQSQRNIPYFIEEECSCVGHFETAHFLGDSPGESALFVAEKFAFQELKRDGRAVKLDERAPAPIADVVDGASD